MSEQVARTAGFSARALASLTLLCAGAWLAPSGVALHVASHGEGAWWSHLFMSLHNAASLVFVAAAVVHVTLNRKALTHYLSARGRECMRFKRELLIAVLGVSGLVLLVGSHALHMR